MSEPLLDVKPANNTPVLYHITDTVLTGILIFLTINLLDRTGLDMQIKSPLKINPPISNSIAFCILEYIVLLITKILLKSAKDGETSHFSWGFIFYIVGLIFFIIESATFYNEKPYDANSYPYEQEKIKQNNYQVVIEVLLRAIGLGTLLYMVMKK